MKKNNLTKEIFLLILVASFTSANFFAMAVSDTNQDGSVNSKSSSSNYEFNSETGAAAVGQSTSSNYILDHGAYWDEYNAPKSTTETFGGGTGTQNNYPNYPSQATYGSSTEVSPNKILIKSVKYDCNFTGECSSIAIIKEIRQYIIQPIFLNNTEIISRNTLPRNMIYILIGFLLILIIIILYFTYKRIKNNLNQGRIESKNKYD